MSAQVIRVRADDRRRLVVDDELSAILRRCELHRDLFVRERGEVRRTARGFSVDRINRGVLADFHALLAWRNQHDPRVQRGLDLLSEGQNALLDLLRDDNRPPCPVIPLRLATVAPAKVPEPPARGKPNRGKPNPDALTGRESGSKEPGHASGERLRAIAERAPEPPARGKPNRGKPNPDRAPSAQSGSSEASRTEKQLRAIAERAPEPARELYRG